MYEKPLPVIDPESQPYWDALKQHRLLLKRCRACQRSHHYPRELCPHCHSDDLEWLQAAGTGRIYSYTVARRPAGPAFKADTPYVVALVELDEGVRLMTNIVTADVESVRIDQRVTVQFDDVTPDVTLPKFRLV
ncbi:Zn-ribbon domain-containing OB-fold protein [Panacagrimonas sp.]|uniref:Zn-ribbon domain-containing OB-fold protein n=1 Tax=Panacagrimonas sp. TaxID=2480088 RepID=UPI003B5164C8